MKWFTVLQRWSFSEMAKQGYWTEFAAVRANSLLGAAPVVEECLINKNRLMFVRFAAKGADFILAHEPTYEIRILTKKRAFDKK